MKATIDSAGGLVIPKVLRDRLGLHPGTVDVEVDGADLRIAATGQPLSDDDVGALRDADQR